MSEKRASLEVIAPTVDEAITKGLGDLGLPENAVEVEVLDAGSRGLFGIGSRQARIRLTIKSGPGAAPAAPRESAPAPAPVVTAPPPVVEPPAPKVTTPPVPEVTPAPAPAPAPIQQPIHKQPAPEQEEEGISVEETLRVARDTVTELLEKMKVRANVTARMGDADESHNKPPVMVDVNGNDLSILIGPRAETLNALQYIASLIVGKELGRSIPMVVDVEGFRARREAQLRQLARRMADQAVKTGRRQVLEPMPANERRLIHIELRANPNVTTESTGDEPRRKVTILPKS